MPLDEEQFRKMLEDAVAKKSGQQKNEKQDRDRRADLLVWAAVSINAGMGAVPFGINIWTFIGVNTALVTLLGSTYGYHLSKEKAAELIKYIFLSAGLSYSMFFLGLKFFAEGLKGAGIITLGGATVVGMALDAVLAGAVTFALGFTVKMYFKKDQQMAQKDIKAEFKKNFAEGKIKVRQMLQFGRKQVSELF